MRRHAMAYLAIACGRIRVNAASLARCAAVPARSAGRRDDAVEAPRAQHARMHVSHVTPHAPRSALDVRVALRVERAGARRRAAPSVSVVVRACDVCARAV